jgi:hypothetical protein
MRGFVRIPLLALGVVLGYGFAFHSMHRHRHGRDAWERHIADVCVGAARSAKGDDPQREQAAPKAESPEP